MSALQQHLSRRRLGFTLMELVTTLVVMSVLAGVGAVAYASIKPRLSDDQTKTMLSAVSTAQQARFRSRGDFVGTQTTDSASTKSQALSELSSMANPSGGFVAGDQSVTSDNQVSVSKGTWNGWIKLVAMAAKSSSGTCYYNVTFDPSSGKAPLEGTLSGATCSGQAVLADPAVSNVPASTTPPGTPGGLVATPGPGTAMLEWSPGSGTTAGYQVFRCQVTAGAPCTNTDPSSGSFSFTYVADVVGSSRFTDTSVSAGSTYKYMVRAFNTSGTSSFTASVSVVPADPSTKVPDRPSGLHVVSAADGNVVLGWTASPSAATYRIYRDGTLLAQGVNITQFPDDGTGRVTPGNPAAPAAGAAYTYRVDAESAAGVSSVYTGLKVVVPPKKPTAVTVTAISSDSATCTAATCAQVTWTAPAYTGPPAAAVPLNSYLVYRCAGTVSDCGPANAGATRVATLTASNPPPVFTDTALAGSSTYTYAVTAVNDGGESPASSSTSVNTALSAPTGVAVTAGAPGELVVSWSAKSGASGYQVYRVTANGTRTVVANVSSGTTWTDTGLGGFTQRTYEVAAVNSVGAGARSASATGVSGPAPLTGVSVTTTDVSANVNWDYATGVTYDVTRNGSTIASGLTTDTYTDTGLTPATTYTYRVVASAATGSASSSNINAVTKPQQVTGVTAATTGTVTSLSWTAPAGTNTYDVKRCAGAGCTVSATLATVSSGTTYTDSTGAANTFYSYTVTAVNSAAVQATASDVVTTATVPTAVGALSATSRASDVRLTWTAVDTATAYDVYRCNSDADSTCTPTLGDLVGTSTGAAYTDTSPVGGVTYRYAVRAKNAAGVAAASLVGVGGRGPNAPDGITATVSSTNPGTGVTNLITNPSFEAGTTGWTNTASNYWINPATSGSSMTSDPVNPYTGSRSLTVVTGTGNVGSVEGVTANVTGLAANTTYTLSANIYSGAAGVQMGLYDTANSVAVSTGYPAYASWTRVSLTLTTGSTGNTTGIIGFRTQQGGTSKTFRVDALSLVASSQSVPYFDGDTPGAWWNGAANASTSSLPAGTRFNLMPNPSVETTQTGWFNYTNGTASVADSASTPGATPVIGSKALRMTAQSAGRANVRGSQTNENPPLVTGGLPYTFSMYASTPNATQTVYATLQWRNSAGTTVATTITNMATVTAGGAPTRIVGTTTPPATATNLSVILSTLSSAAGDIVDFDAAMLEQSSTAGTYFDSATVGATSAPRGESIFPNTGYATALTWNAPTAAGVTYDVFRCVGTCAADSTAFTTLATGLSSTTRAYTDTSVVPGVTYSYTVRGVVGALTGEKGVPAVTTVTLDNPTNLAYSSITPTTATATWTYSLGATGYIIKDDSNNTLATVSGSRTQTAALTGLSAGSQYTLKAYATSASGAVSSGSTAAVLTTPVPAPAVPNLVSTATSTISVNWSAIATGPGTTYDVYTCNGAGCTPNVKSVADLSATSATITGLSANTQYNIAVVAKTVYATSTMSTSLNAWTTATAPSGLTVAGVAGGRTNLVANPSFSVNSTGWVNAARTTSQNGAGPVTAAGTFTGNGVYSYAYPYTTINNLTPGVKYSSSVMMRADTTVTGPRRAYMKYNYYNDTTYLGASDQGTPTALSNSAWTTYTFTPPTGTPAGTNRIDIYYLVDSSGTGILPATDTFYIDAALTEAGTTAGPYFDGSSPNAVWNGAADNSTSVTSPVGPNNATLTWSAVPNATSYTVYRNGQTAGTSTTPAFYDVTKNLIAGAVATGGDISGATAIASSGTGVPLEVSTDDAVAGTKSLKATATSSSVANAGLVRVNNVPVEANTAYTLSMQVRKPATGSVNFSALPQINWFDASGTVISSTTGTLSPLNTTWTQVSATGTSPSNAATAQIRYQLGNPTGVTGTAIAYVDNIQLEAGNAVTAFSPGTLDDQATATYTVAVTNPGGLSAQSSSAVATLPPGPPTNVSALGGYRTTNVTFNTVAGITAYRVFRCTGTTCLPNTALTDITTSGATWTYTDTTTTSDNTSYTYRIAGLTGTAAGRASATTTATTVNAIATLPGTPFTSITSTSATYTWNAPAGATTYQIYRCAGTTCNPVTNPDSGFPLTQSTTTLTQAGLTAGASYTYAVVAGNGSGWAPASATAVLTLKPVSPATVANSPSATKNTISLAWNAGAANLTGYRVRIGANPSAVAAGTGGAIDVNTATTSYTFTGLTPATTYSVSVTALNSYGESDATTATLSTRPNTPVNLTGTGGPGTGENTLTWTAPSAGTNTVTRYSLYREGNAISNPSFTTDVTGWTKLVGGQTPVTQALAAGRNGTNGLLVTSPGSANGAYTTVTTNGAGRIFYTAWIKGPAGDYTIGSYQQSPTASSNVQYGVTTKTTDPNAADNKVTVTAGNANTWIQLQGERDVPAGETQTAIVVRSTASTGTWVIDDAAAYTYSFSPTTNDNGGTTTPVCTKTSTAPATPASTCTDTGLADATEYTYVVTADTTGTGSAVTESAASWPVTVTTLAPPPVLGRTNLIQNPSFENTVSGWTNHSAGAATFTPSTDFAYSGTYSAKVVTVAGGRLSLSSGVGAPAYRSPVTEGATYNYRTYLRATAGSDMAGLEVLVYFYNAAGTQIGSYIQAGTDTTINSTGWTSVGGTVAAPAGAASTAMLIYQNSTVGGSTFYVDGVQIENGQYPGTFFDGSTTPGGAWSVPASPNASTSTMAATTATGTTVTVNWTAPKGNITGYNVYRCATTSCTPTTLLTTTATPGYVDNAASNTTYTYRVTALTPNSTGTSESAPSATTTISTVPNPGTALTATWVPGSSNTVTVNWTGPSPTTATGYRIYRCIGATCTATAGNLLATTATTTPGYTDTTATPATTYTYTITAYNNAGTSSATTLASPLYTPPAPPTLNAGTTTTTSVPLTWTAVTPASGYTGTVTYNIYRCTDNTTTAPTCVPSSILGSTTSTTYTDNTATDGVSYAYRISVTTDVEGPKSGTNLVATTKPAAITLNQGASPADVNAGGTFVNVKFVKKSYTDNYRIAYCAGAACDPVGAPTATVDVTVGSPAGGTNPGYVHTITGLTPGQTYRVAVYTLLGVDTSAASNVAATETTVDPPASVTIDTTRTNKAINPSVETTDASIRWNGQTNASSPTRDTTSGAAKFGTAAFRVTATAAGDVEIYNGRTGSADTPNSVLPNTTYSASMWLKRGTTTGNVALKMLWYKAPGVLSTVSGATAYSTAVSASAATWTQVSLLNMTAPSDMPANGTGYVVLMAKYTAAAAGEQLWADGSQLEQAPTLNSAFFDGTTFGLNSGYSYGTTVGTWPNQTAQLTNAAGNTIVSWTPPAVGLVGTYRIYRCNTSVSACATSGPDISTDLLTTVTSPTVTYNDTSTVPGTNYKYRVHSVSGGGVQESAGTTPATVTTSMRPDAPTSAAASAVATTSATLTWVNAPGASAHQVFPGTAGVNSAQAAAVETSPKNYTGLAANSVYQYLVAAQNGSLWGPPSNLVDFTTVPATPAAPTSLTSYDSATTTGTLTFTAPTANAPITVATEYTINAGATVASVTTGGPVTLPAANTTYNIQIRTAATYKGNVTRSGWSPALSFTTPPATPAAPTLTVDHQNVAASWAPSPVAPNGSTITYNVLRSTTGNGPGSTPQTNIVEQSTTATSTPGAYNALPDNAATGTDILGTTAGPNGVGTETITYNTFPGANLDNLGTATPWTSTGTLSASGNVVTQTGSAATATATKILLPGRTYTLSAATNTAGQTLSVNIQNPASTTDIVHTSAASAAGTDRISITFTTPTLANTDGVPVLLKLTNPGVGTAVTWTNPRLVRGSTVVDPHVPGTASGVDATVTVRSNHTGCTTGSCATGQSGDRATETMVPNATGGNIVVYQLTHPGSTYTASTAVTMTVWAKAVTGAGNNLTVIPQLISTDAQGTVTVLASGSNATPTATYAAYTVTGVTPATTPNRLGVRLVTPTGSTSTANVTLALDALMSTANGRLPAGYASNTYLPGTPEAAVNYTYALTATNTTSGGTSLASPTAAATTWMPAPAWLRITTTGDYAGAVPDSSRRIPFETAPVPSATSYIVSACTGTANTTCTGGDTYTLQTVGFADQSTAQTSAARTGGATVRYLVRTNAETGAPISGTVTAANTADTALVATFTNRASFATPTAVTSPASTNTLAATFDGGAVQANVPSGHTLMLMRESAYGEVVRLKTPQTGTTQVAADTADNSYNVLPEYAANTSDTSLFNGPSVAQGGPVHETGNGLTTNRASLRAYLPASSSAGTHLVGTSFIAEPGKQYAFTAWTRADTGTYTGGRIGVRAKLTYTNAAGTPSTFYGANTYLTNAWTQLYVRNAAPANTVDAQVSIEYVSYTGPGTDLSTAKYVLDTAHWMVANSPDATPRDSIWYAGARTDNQIANPTTGYAPANNWTSPSGVTVNSAAAPSAGAISYDADNIVTSVTVTSNQTSGSNVQLATSTQKTAVRPGSTYTFTGVVRSPGQDTTLAVAPTVTWTNSAGATLSTTAGTATTTGQTWNRFTLNATAPTNAAYAQIGYQAGSTTVPSTGLSAAPVTQLVSTGNGYCALRTTGYVYCWGASTYGELGVYALTATIATPRLLTNDTYTAIAGGHNGLCAVTTTAQMRCWGAPFTTTFGTDGNTSSYTVVTGIGSLNTLDTSSFALNTNAVCATTAVGTYCAGRHNYIGDGVTTTELVTNAIAISNYMALGLRKLSAGDSHMCAIATSGSTRGQAYCWGNNSNGQVGNGSTSQTYAASIVSGARQYTSVSAFANTTCALTMDNTRWCWGQNNQAGYGSSAASSNVPVTTGTRFTTAASGATSWTPCGQSAVDGSLYCMGVALNGQYGNGSTTSSTAPVKVTSTKSFVPGLVAGTTLTNCAVATDNTIYCWGTNTYNELGNGVATTTVALTPVPVAMLTPTLEIDATRFTRNAALGIYDPLNRTTITETPISTSSITDINITDIGTNATIVQPKPAATLNSVTATASGTTSTVTYPYTAMSGFSLTGIAAALTVPGDITQPTTADAPVTLTAPTTSPYVRTVTGYTSNALPILTRIVGVTSQSRPSPDGFQTLPGYRPVMSTPTAPAITVTPPVTISGNTSPASETIVVNASGVDTATYTGWFPQLQRRPSGTGTWNAVALTNPDSQANPALKTTTVLTGSAALPYGGTWEYQTRNCNETGCSDWSATYTYTVPFTATKNLAGTNVSATMNLGGVGLDDATYYGVNNFVSKNDPSAAWFSPAFQANANSASPNNDKASTNLSSTIPASTSNVRTLSGWVYIDAPVGSGTTSRGVETLFGQTSTADKADVSVDTWQAGGTQCIGWANVLNGAYVADNSIGVAVTAGANPIHVSATVTGGTDLSDRSKNKLLINGTQSPYSPACTAVAAQPEGSYKPVRTTLAGPMEGKTITKLLSGASHTCALTRVKELYCWGSNVEGNFGIGNNQGSTIPVLVNGPGTAIYGYDITDFSVGNSLTCVIAGGYNVYCAGNNGQGNLGRGTIGASSNTWASITTPVKDGVAQTVIAFGAIYGGADHTCVTYRPNRVVQDGIICWGHNDQGQVGNNTNTAVATPTVINSGGLTGKDITEMTIPPGGSTTCARSSDNLIYCWGRNDVGQLGDGTTTARLTVPATAINTTGALAGKTINSISAGEVSTCAVANNAVYCWGYNVDGRLGVGDTSNKLTPTAVVTNTGLAGKTVTTVSQSQVARCVTTAEKQLYCWGGNTQGQLGDGTTTLRTTPTPVTQTGTTLGTVGVSQLDSGYQNSCVLAADNSVYCWGANNAGQLGNASASTSLTPSLAATGVYLTGKTITKIVSSTNGAAVGNHTCALTSGGQVYCWGRGVEGQLGNGNYGTQNGIAYNSRPSPVDAGPFNGQPVTDISAAHGTTCAVAGGKAYCWGYNVYGQLGDGTTTNRYVPTPVSTAGDLSGKSIKQVTAGWKSACAVTTDNIAACWGYNNDGRLGLGSAGANVTTPSAVNTATGLAGKTITDIALGGYGGCAVASAQLYCWGGNLYGEVGDGTTTQRNSPTLVSAFAGKTVTDFSIGDSDQAPGDDNFGDSCAVANSQAYCWGLGTYGQLANSNTATQTTPVLINNGAMAGKTIVKVESGNITNCAIDNTGAAYCWGLNDWGQTGNGSNNAGAPTTTFNGLRVNTAPVTAYTTGVAAGKTVKDIAMSFRNTCALLSDNTITCTGWNNPSGTYSTGNPSRNFGWAGGLADVASQNASQTVVIGAYDTAGGDAFRGGLYDVAVHNGDATGYFTGTTMSGTTVAASDRISTGDITNYSTQMLASSPAAFYKFTGTIDAGATGGLKDWSGNGRTLAPTNRNSNAATTVPAGTSYFGATNIQPSKFTPTTSNWAGLGGGLSFPIMARGGQATCGYFVGARGAFGCGTDQLGAGFDYQASSKGRAARGVLGGSGAVSNANNETNIGHVIELTATFGSDDGLLWRATAGDWNSAPFTGMWKVGQSLRFTTRLATSGALSSVDITPAGGLTGTTRMIHLVHNPGTSETTAAVYIDGQLVSGSPGFGQNVCPTDLSGLTCGWAPRYSVGGYEDVVADATPTNNISRGPVDTTFLDFTVWTSPDSSAPFGAAEIARQYATRNAN